VKFSELVRLLEENGFRIVKEKGSIDTMKNQDGAT
jgi:predicted RNA binding protein YcfA (HicA-like mRNA interferase family)